MKKLSIALLVIATMSPLWAFEIVGFVTDYGNGHDIEVEDFDKVSTFSWFTAAPQTNCSLKVPGSFTENSAAIYAEYGNTTGTRSLLAVGGAVESGNFSRCVGAGYRNGFINNIVAKVNELSMNGVDIDWEFPGWADYANLYSFVIELRAKLPAGAIITINVPATSFNGQHFQANVLNAVDYINIMSYDDYWSGDYNHSSYAKMLNHIQYWTNTRGVSKDKIIVGVPFYGRSSAGALEYFEIVRQYTVTESSDQAGGYYFNSVNTIKQKVQYLKDNGFAGVMIWQMRQDVDGPLSLLEAINDIVTPEFHEEVVPISSSEEVSSSAEISSSVEVSSSIEVSSSSEPISSSLPVPSETESLIDWSQQYGIKVSLAHELGLEFSNPSSTPVNIKLYNVFGELLHQSQTQSTSVGWDKPLSSGVYFIEMSSRQIPSSNSLKFAIQ